jgi:hypothetical protein
MRDSDAFESCCDDGRLAARTDRDQVLVPREVQGSECAEEEDRSHTCTEEKENIRWLDNLKQSTELPGDAARYVHFGDRESDIYELFCTAHDASTQFLLRTCVDRLAGDDEHTIASEMDEIDCKGLHRVEVRDRHGKISEAVLELNFRRILMQAPLYKQRRYPALESSSARKND